MYTYPVRFLALTDSIAFNISSENEETLDHFAQELLALFANEIADDMIIKVNYLQRNSAELVEKIDHYTKKVLASNPQLGELSAYFKRLKDGEEFYILPGMDLDAFEKAKLFDYLKSRSKGLEFDEYHSRTKDLFEDLMKKYDLAEYGRKRVNIGNPIKSNRVCRFCGKREPEASYRAKAHAISESMGNKTVILFDECDSCNLRLSKSIEPDIVRYNELLRTMFDIKGKGGSKQTLGHNFNITRSKETGGLILSYSSEDSEQLDPNQPVVIPLIKNEPIILQNVYKCFCKYFISVVDSGILPEFVKTIEWINGVHTIDRLPPVAELLSYHAFAVQPRLVTYLRRESDTTLPFAVGEFYFACKVWAFIVPFATPDDRDFTSKADYNHFWQTFKHYGVIDAWQFNDYSKNDPSELALPALEWAPLKFS